MLQKKTIINKANSNYHRISGEDLFKKDGISFKEYRKKWRKWPEEFYVGAFPLFVDIEVTSVCNLQCPFCATTFREKEISKGFMPSDIVKKIIDEGADNNLYGVKFNIRGEPLLHPQIHEFVKYAKKKGLIDVYFNTNAALLTEDISRRLIDAGLDRISISFEGYTKDVYDRYRVGAKYEEVLSNIENMQALKEKLGAGYPKIRVQTVMFEDLKTGLDEYKKFWSDRVDEVGFLDYKEMKEKRKGVKYPWACPQLWQRMGVWWDGTILPCNHDDGGLLNLGNVKQVTIKAAWHSEELNRIRVAHVEGRAEEISACDGCYLRDSEILKLKKKEDLYGK